MTAFGRIVSAPLVERGIEGTLRAVLGAYIGEVCAQLGYDRNALPDPEQVQRLTSLEAFRQGEQVGALVIASDQTLGDAQREADGYVLMWEISAGIVCDLGDPLATREAAQIMAAAIGTCLTHQGCSEVAADSSDAVIDADGQLVSLAGSHVWLLGEQYTRLPSRPDLVMGGASLMVRVDDARSLAGGPEMVPDVDEDGHVIRVPLEDGEPSDIVPDVDVDRVLPGE